MHNNWWLIQILHWTNSMRTGRNLNWVRNITTVIPSLEMESQIILLLVTIASLGSVKYVVPVTYATGGTESWYWCFFRGSSQISLLHGNIFKEVVEKIIEDHWGRLIRLMKYTTGEAKDLIKHCIQQPLSEGYKNALELLKIRYGDPLKVLAE